jgi:hypothetical protein
LNPSAQQRLRGTSYPAVALCISFTGGRYAIVLARYGPTREVYDLSARTKLERCSRGLNAKPPSRQEASEGSQKHGVIKIGRGKGNESFF